MARRPSEKPWLVLTNSWGELEQDLATAEEVLLEIEFEPQPGKGTKRLRRKARERGYGSVIPTTPTTNVQEIQFWLTNALEMIDGLRRLISRRKPSVELTLSWGAFQYSCGMVLSAVVAWKEDEGRRRSGVEGGKKVSKLVQKKWVARELLKLMKTSEYKQRHQAEAALARKIKVAITAIERSDPQRTAFLQGLLNKDGVLHVGYTARRFSDSSMNLAARAGMNDIPAALRTS